MRRGWTPRNRYNIWSTVMCLLKPLSLAPFFLLTTPGDYRSFNSPPPTDQESAELTNEANTAKTTLPDQCKNLLIQLSPSTLYHVKMLFPHMGPIVTR